MYQVSPMNWLLIFCFVSFLMMYFYILMFFFEDKIILFKTMKKIYVK